MRSYDLAAIRLKSVTPGAKLTATLIRGVRVPGGNMAGSVRIRDDVWKLSVGTLAAAGTQPWDPVLDGYARGVEAMGRGTAR